jgi:hypothetical protein
MTRFIVWTDQAKRRAAARIERDLATIFPPKVPDLHSAHTVPVVGCDACDAALQEARELDGEQWL